MDKEILDEAIANVARAEKYMELAYKRHIDAYQVCYEFHADSLRRKLARLTAAGKNTDEVRLELAEYEKASLVDIREYDEWEASKIPFRNAKRFLERLQGMLSEHWHYGPSLVEDFGRRVAELEEAYDAALMHEINEIETMRADAFANNVFSRIVHSQYNSRISRADDDTIYIFKILNAVRAKYEKLKAGSQL